MTTTIKRGASKKTIALKLQELSESSGSAVGIDAYQFCGVIKLKQSPEKIQRKLRDEWK